jgi:hypothetical protein
MVGFCLRNRLDIHSYSFKSKFIQANGRWLSVWINDTNYNNALIFIYEQNSIFNNYYAFAELNFFFDC